MQNQPPRHNTCSPLSLHQCHQRDPLVGYTVAQYQKHIFPGILTTVRERSFIICSLLIKTLKRHQKLARPTTYI